MYWKHFWPATFTFLTSTCTQSPDCSLLKRIEGRDRRGPVHLMGDSEVTADPANHRGRHADAMDAVEPDARPHGPKLQIATGLLDELHSLIGQPSAALQRMARYQASRSTGHSAPMPDPNRLAVQSEPSGSAFEAVVLGIA